MFKKIAAWLLLVILLVVPFVNWRVGAVIWLCAWLTYISQMAISGLRNRKSSPEDD